MIRIKSKAGTANAIYSPRDGSAPLGEFTVGSFPFTWTLRRPDGSVYGRKGYSSNNEFFWTDHLGSVRVRTSNSGSMLEAHDYYPFGLDMPGRSSAGLPMRQGFTGYWRDREGGLGLYDAGARMYSPGTGRFFGVDPLAEEFATWSPYVYTFNNPVNWRDPDGRCPISITGQPCTPGGVTYIKSTRSESLQQFASGVASALNAHVTVHSGDRTHVPEGGSKNSEHLVPTINPNAKGAIDFKVYNEEGIQISDKVVVAEILKKNVDKDFGVRIILHDVGTNTEAPHIHADKRVDKGHLIETKGRYKPINVESDLEN